MIQRRSFLAALIGAALAPRLILEPMRPEARARIEGPAWADGGTLKGRGMVTDIRLRGIADESMRADFSIYRPDGTLVMQHAINGWGGLMAWCSPWGDGPIFAPEAPLLLRTHEALDGEVVWQPLDGSSPVHVPIRRGVAQVPIRAWV